MLAANPVWDALALARDVISLPDKVVLHAGPPIAGKPCAPIRNSAAMAVLFEGWAAKESDAFAMIDSGEVALRPAQDFNVVVPLAAVLTGNMVVHVVTDAANPENRTYAPINGGNGPAMRLGKSGALVVQHLRWLNGPLIDLLKPALRHDIPLIAIANEALKQGDDLHGRTPASTELLCRSLFADAAPPPFIRQSPSFFLNLWMAACKCMAMAGSGIAGSSLITAIGGNGDAVGLKVSGLPDRWFSVPAQPPQGSLEAGFSADDCLGAIGDSAIVDAVGFGAMAMHCAPAQEKALAAYMPAPSRALGATVMTVNDPRFLDGATIRTGLLAAHVVEAGTGPAVSLGIIHKTGHAGRIGGGIFTSPLELFALAGKALRKDG